MSQFDLTDKVILVTGAAGGLGRAFAVAFAEAGSRVVCTDLNEAGVQETAQLISDQGGQALSLAVNVVDPGSTEQMVQTVLDQWGQIDVLINNAAVYAGLTRKPFWEIDPAEWDRVFSVNVKGVWLTSKIVGPTMFERGGKIINISSGTFFSGSPDWLHYVASKGSVIGMTRSMARELGDFGITVNAIAPGFTLTEASLSIIENATDYGIQSRALKRSAQTDDIVGTALFWPPRQVTS